MPTNRWTKNQQRAIAETSKPLAIIAGAGSGKTEVLTQRLLHLLKKEKLGLRQILALTFTDKAGQELKNRLAGHLSPEQKIELPFAAIGTVHRFCLSLLKEHAATLELSDALGVWDEHTTKLAIHKHCRLVLLKALEEKNRDALELVESLEFRHALTLLEELLQFRWHFEQRGAVEKEKEDELAKATKNIYRQILASLTEEKNQRQILDFQDLEIRTLRLLTEHPQVLKNLQKKFRHILVDEAQDISDLQRLILEKLFVPKLNTLCLVGDPKQSIYRFRGANVEGFKKLIRLITQGGGSILELRENFRSRPAVIDFINRTFQNLLPPAEETPLIATREAFSEAGVEVVTVEAEPSADKEERRKKEAGRIAEILGSFIEEKKFRPGEIALLFQSLTEVRHYEKALREAGIPFRIFGGRGFLQAQEVNDLLFCLKLMGNLEDRLALVGLMRSPLLGMDDLEITRLCAAHPAGLGRALLQQDEAQWLKELYENREALSAAALLSQAIAKTHYDTLCYFLDPSGMKLANVEQFLELVRQLEIQEEMDLENLLDYFETLKKRRAAVALAPSADFSNDCCQLMTVHAAKGLQFPVVILPDLLRELPNDTARYLFLKEEGLSFERPAELKEKERHLDREERKRLLYVAMTRAEEKLVIPIHPEAKRSGLWHEWLKEAVERSGEVGRPSLSQRASALLERSSPEIRPPYGGFNSRRSEAQPLLWGSPHKIGAPPRKQCAGALDKEGRTNYYTTTELKQKPFDTVAPAFAITSGLQGTALGNLVHAVLKELKTKSAADIPELVKTKIIELEMVTNFQDRENAARLIENLLRSEIAPPAWDGEHELPFRLKAGPAVVTGMIDYCLETDKGWVIYDFKTDAAADPEKYRLQMDTYALALSKAKGQKVLETRLLFLKSGKSFTVPVTPERLTAAEAELHKRIAEKLKENNKG